MFTKSSNIYYIIFLKIIFILFIFDIYSENNSDRIVIKLEDAFNVPLKISDVLTSESQVVPTPAEKIADNDQITSEAAVAQLPESIVPTPTPTPSPEEIRQKKEQEIAAKGESVQKLLDRGRETEAKEMLSKIINENPSSKYAPQFLYTLGRLESNIPDAIIILDDVINKYPDTIWAGLSLFKKGEYFFFLGDYKNSEENLTKYLNTGWDKQFREKAYRNLLAVQMRLSKYNESKNTLNLLWSEFPVLQKDPSLLESNAEILMELNNYTDALEKLNIISSNFPSYSFISRVLLNKGFCHEALNQKDNAAKIYNDLVSLFPQSIESDLAQIRLNDIKKPLYTITLPTKDTDSSTTPTTSVISLNTNVIINDDDTTGNLTRDPLKNKYQSKNF